MLSKKQVADICMVGQGSDQCRYATFDTLTGHWNCYKLRPVEKVKINKKLGEVYDKLKAMGHDPAKAGYALGDNCSGYPLLKTLEQGYDKP